MIDLDVTGSRPVVGSSKNSKFGLFANALRLSENKGKIIWSRLISGNKNNKYKFFGPTLAGGHIWVTGTDGRLRKFDPVSGEQIVEYNFRNPVLYV